MKRNDIVVAAIAIAIAVPSGCCGLGSNMGGKSRPEIEKADKLFGEGTFQSAMEEYRKAGEAAKAAKDIDVEWMAFHREVECLTHLFRYGEATQKLVDTAPPADMPMKARILFLKAEVLQSFLMQYSWIQPDDVIEGVEGADAFKKTPKEIRAEIGAAYEELWKERKDLAGMEIADEAYFLDVTNVDRGSYPTMLDAVVYSWTEWLKGMGAPAVAGEGARADADAVIVEKLEREVDFADPPGLLAAEIMEAAGKVKALKRKEAVDRWKVKRLLLPFDTVLFSMKDPKASSAGAKRILAAWFEDLPSKGGRAAAGYGLARFQRDEGDLVGAVATCREVEKLGGYDGWLARVMREEITEPSMQVAPRTAQPPAKQVVTLATRNMKRAYYRIHAIDPKKLMSQHKEMTGWDSNWSSVLGYVDTDWMEKYLGGTEVVASGETAIADKGDHKEVKTRVEHAEIGKGIYLVLVSDHPSFAKGSHRLSAGFVNVTDLVMVGTPGPTATTRDAYAGWLTGKPAQAVEDEAFRLYVLDAGTGRPVQGAGLDVFKNTSNANGYKSERDEVASDEGGVAKLKAEYTLTAPPPADPTYGGYGYYGYGTSVTLDPLAGKDGSWAYWGSSKYSSWTPPGPVQVYVETDRPIYRPGQEIQVKVVAFKRTPDGYRTMGKGRTARIVARDPNGEVFLDESLDLGEFGSASAKVVAPKGKLLGAYSITVLCADGPLWGQATSSVRIEEYKQPEFEIALEKALDPWKYGSPAKITGKVSYYFGGPVVDAAVEYRVTRQSWVPWYYRAWFAGGGSAGADEVAYGKITTDAEGKFEIPVVPEPPPSLWDLSDVPDIAEFVVAVNARDSGGRTISGTERYRAGKQSLYFTMEPTKGFFGADEKVGLDAGLFTINETPAEGKSSFTVWRLADEPAKPLRGEAAEDGTIVAGGWGADYGGAWGWVPPLDVQLEKVKNGEEVAHGEARHDAEGKAVIEAGPLAPGAYRVRIEAADPLGGKVEQTRIFTVAAGAGEGTPVEAASIMLPEKESYEVGEKARFLMGSALASSFYQIEIWTGEYLSSAKVVDAGQDVTVIEVPVDERMKGGFTVRWFGVKGLDVLHNEATVAVPWSEKKLAVAVEPFTEKLAPGEQASWGVTVKDAAGKPAKAEVLALMYDRALEYYAGGSDLSMAGLWAAAGSPWAGADSVFTPYMADWQPDESIIQKLTATLGKTWEPPKAPGLRTWDTWAGGRPGGLMDRIMNKSGIKDQEYAMQEEASPSAAPPPAPMEADKAMARSAAVEGKMKKGDEGGILGLLGGGKAAPGMMGASAGPAKALAEVEARTSFSDTAFFMPHLTTAASGSAKIEFTAPEQLTSWKMSVAAFTVDAKEGSVTTTAVTKKDLMVRADLPRFFREKDKGTITAVVHNESEGTMEGDLAIEVLEDGEPVTAKIGIAAAGKEFSVPAHGLTSFEWKVSIPDGVTEYEVRVAAKAGDLEDAEVRKLPILPSRQRLIESVVVVLKGKEEKKLAFDPEDDPTRIDETMVLQVDPQITLSLLNTIPYLVEYPFDCTEQVLNRYVPLAIVSKIFEKYPAIAKATAKIPHRDTILPPWEEDDPRRLIQLTETPWVRAASGYHTTLPMIEMIDPAMVKAQREISLSELKALQMPSGAFPWFPGGWPDEYITLLVLDGFAEAKRFGVEPPADLVDAALGYVNSELLNDLKKEDRDLAMMAFAAYVVTSYSPDEYANAAYGHEKAKKWVKFLDQHVNALTPFGKAYLAYTYERIGSSKRAGEILDMIMDSAREDPMVGVYFTPEKYSWVWYSDTVETHAFIMRTLQELRPDDARIPGMMQWLLFNRKGNSWKSTKASAAAVFALLDVMEKTGALSTPDTFEVDWADTSEDFTVEPDDWIDEPLRWIASGEEITPAHLTATVDKGGKGTAFASLTWIYSTDKLPEASTPGLLEVKRTFYRRVKEGSEYHLVPVEGSTAMEVGDEIVVRLVITAKSQFEYMHLMDPKAAGFEAEALLSGWKWAPLAFYEEPRDSLTNFFVSWLPQGEYVVTYKLRPTKKGTYRVGAATLQSMYAPEMTAHSSGLELVVK